MSTIRFGSDVDGGEQPASGVPSDRSASARVLIVDDEEAVLRSFEVALAQAGYEVLTAATGAEALEIAARERPDVVLLDRHLDDISGQEVLDRLRADEATRGSVILIVSGDAELDRRLEGLGAGANDYIVKPVDLRELLARISSHLKWRDRWLGGLSETMDAQPWERAGRGTEHISVVVLANHQMTAETYARALDGDARFEGVAVTTEMDDDAVDQALERVTSADPEVVVTHLPVDEQGMAIVEAIATDRSRGRVLVVSARADDQTLMSVIRCGADGFVTVDEPFEAIAKAIERIAGGEAVFSIDHLSRLLRRTDGDEGGEPGLSPREIDVIRRLSAGESTKQIASELGLSVNTVRNHVTSILAKLDAHSRLEAVGKAIRLGIIAPPS